MRSTFYKTNVLARRGFTLVEILVTIGIIAILMGILLPAMERVREQANTTRCMSNLHQIGAALFTYANDNQGNFPRTVYQPGILPTAGTGTAANPFATNGPQPNDTSAPLFLLMRAEKLPPTLFADPYNDEVEFVPDSGNLDGRSNFADFRMNLAYSFANPYPDSGAVNKGYVLNTSMNAAFVIGADQNPGTGPGHNSRNHEGEGQNVLFADSHAEWKTTTNVGVDGDDIYSNKNGDVQASPVDAGDSVLLPTAKAVNDTGN